MIVVLLRDSDRCYEAIIMYPTIVHRTWSVMGSDYKGYEPPRIIEYGDFEDLTQGRGSVGNDRGARAGRNRGKGQGGDRGGR